MTAGMGARGAGVVSRICAALLSLPIWAACSPLSHPTIARVSPAPRIITVDQAVASFSTPLSAIHGMVWSPDGHLLAALSGFPTDAGREAGVAVFDPFRGTLLAAFPSQKGGPTVTAFSGDGSLFAAASTEVNVWRTSDWRHVTTIALPNTNPLQVSAIAVGLAFGDRPNDLFVLYNRTQKICGLAAGVSVKICVPRRQAQRLESGLAGYNVVSSSIKFSVFVKNGVEYTSDVGSPINLASSSLMYSAETKQLIYPRTEYHRCNPAYRDTSRAYPTYADFRNASNGSLSAKIDNIQVEQVSANAISLDGNVFATSTQTGSSKSGGCVSIKDDDPIRIWSAKDRKLLLAIPEAAFLSDGEPRHLSLDSDGGLLAECSDRSDQGWAVSGVVNVWATSTGAQVARFQIPLGGPSAWLTACAIDPTGRYVAAGAGSKIFALRVPPRSGSKP